MKNYYIQKLTTDDTQIDFNYHVPVTELVHLFNVATFNHSTVMGMTHQNMIEKSNCFWVVTKIKLKIEKPIYTGENIEIKTWTHAPSLVRFARDSKLTVNGEVRATMTSEWCCLDYTTLRPRKASTVFYPELEMEETESLDHSWTNPRITTERDNYVYTKTIRATDIDVNNHTNNLRYNFMVLDAFTTEELLDLDIHEYEMYYVNQSHEGDKIDIFKKAIDNGFYVEGKLGDTVIFKCVLR